MLEEMVNNGTIALRKILSGFNLSDIYSKCFIRIYFQNHRGKIMNGFGGDPANIHRYMDEYA